MDAAKAMAGTKPPEVLELSAAAAASPAAL
jgi:hypothetical protein